MRLNVSFDVVRTIGNSLQVERTPTFILFDAQGQEIQRWVGEAPSVDDLPSQNG